MDPTNCRSEQRRTVLFLCHHNAVRSQMAEAILRARFPHRYEAASAGTEPAEVHPLTILALQEVGVSTSELRSKHVEELVGHGFDLVVTVCGHDEPTCPFFPGGRQIHRSFDDPSTVIGSKEHRLAAFRRVRDEIDAWIREAFGTPAR
jgi:arsenate reductase